MKQISNSKYQMSKRGIAFIAMTVLSWLGSCEPVFAQTVDIGGNIDTAKVRSTPQATINYMNNANWNALRNGTAGLKVGTIEGNGAGLTGITGATGGVSNDGSTTIGADTDVNGVGEVDIQTRNLSRLQIHNNGDIEVIGNLLVKAQSLLDSVTKLRNERNLYNQFHSGADWSRSAARNAKGSNFQAVPAPNPIPVVFIGNSLTASIPGYFMKALQDGHGWVGLGMDAPAQGKYSGFIPITKTAWTEYAGDYSAQKRWGISGSSLYGVTGDTLRWAPLAGLAVYGFEYTDARIWFLKQSGGGTFKIHIDNGVGIEVSTSGTADELGYYSLSGLSDYAHSITIDSISSDLWLYGIETFNSGRYGIEPIWLCTGGVRASTEWEARLGFLRPLFDVLKPAIVNVWLGANDAGQSVSGSTYSAAIRRIVDTLQTIDTAAIVLWTSYGRGSAPGTEDATYLGIVTEYRDSIIAISREKGVSCWDTHLYWPAYREAYDEGLYSDLVHPSGTGASFLVKGIMDWLSMGERTYVTEWFQAHQLKSDDYYGYRYTIDSVDANSGIYVRNSGNTSRAVVLDKVLNFYGRSAQLNGEVGTPSFLSAKNIDARPDYLKLIDENNNFRLRVDSAGHIFTLSPYSDPLFQMSGPGGTTKISSPGGVGFKLEQSGVGTDIITSGFGKVGINSTSVGDSALHVNGGIDGRGANLTGSITAQGFFVSSLNTPPVNASATGTAGEIRFGTDGYLYLCTATNTWVRTQLTTW